MNASWIEWVWIVVAFIAWVIKMFLVASARAHYRHHRYGTNVQVFMARSVYYHMGHMFVAFTLCLIAAGWAITNQPPPPPIYQTQSFMIAVFFLSVNVVLLAHALKVAQWWDRLEEGHYNGDNEVTPQSHKSVVTIATTVTSDPQSDIKIVNTDHQAKE